MKHTFSVVFENGPGNLSTYAPDIPGCVSVGDTLEEARRNMREAMTHHIDLVLERGGSMPVSKTSIQDAIDLHNDGLVELYEEMGEDPPDPPAIVELVEIDTPQAAIRQAQDRRIPEVQRTGV